MDRLQEQTPDDKFFLELFRVLRVSTARVSDEFARGVSVYIKGLVDEERLESPSVVEIVERLTLDSVNILTDTVSTLRKPERPFEDSDDDLDDS